jgi:3,4-dihydroxy 2-butanone 4-phosphate synthase/GTP cyclohydrolase II
MTIRAISSLPHSTPAGANQELTRVAAPGLPTSFGAFRIYGYRHEVDGTEHVALVMGDPTLPGTLVRVHSECLTGDVFGSMRCDCGPQRDAALRAIAEEGRGVLVYLRQEGRGIGLLPKLQAYELQEQGLDTVEANLALGFPADMRTFDIGARILQDLGVQSVRLMTNNPYKVKDLESLGVTVDARVPIVLATNIHNDRYMATKVEKLDHVLDDAPTIRLAARQVLSA